MNRILLAIGLLMIVVMGVVPACSESSDVVHVGVNAKDASLVEIWEAVVEEAGVQDAEANLSELSLWLGEDGSIDMLHYIFYARDAEGDNRMYVVQSNYDGDVTCYSWDPSTADAFGQIHPLTVFEEMGKVPLTSVQDGHESYIDLGFVAGDIGYGDAAHPYLLKDGELVPLKEVIFHTSTPWAEIRLVQGSASVQHWFFSSELDKAESVDYA